MGRKTPRCADAALFEALEGRTLLAYTHPMTSALPNIDAMESEANTVVRFHTNFGFIDVEMYDQVAPGTVANFLEYVRDGAYDNMFFHRKRTDFVLQGGGYKFRDGVGKTDIDERDAIQNEFNRPNTERTIAMARIGGQPNSATSQFYFNLKDNPELNTIDGGFTVFGKVIAGWGVVLQIEGLQTRDYDGELNGVEGFFFDDVPVVGGAQTPSESTLVMTMDAEIIKGGGNNQFYAQSVYYPEGFRNDQIVERVDLVNADSGQNNYYQIIVRYESGERDQVVASGVLTPLQRKSIKIVGGVDMVREGVGYSFEIRSTRVLAASLNHRDFGVTLGESFISTLNQPENALKVWNFAAGFKGAGHRTFLLWDNLTAGDVTINLVVYPQNQAAIFLSFPLEAYRRGGVGLHNLQQIPNNRAFSVRINATGAVVAAMSHYHTASGVSEGDTALGSALGGRSEGYLAAARLPNGATTTLSVMYATASPASILVDFDFFMQDGSVIHGKAVHLTSLVRRKDVDLATLGVTQLPANQFFSIRYKVRSGSTPVSVVYTQKFAGDTMSTPFTTASNNNLYFADGFLDPAAAGTTYSEVISIFNPYQSSAVTMRWGIQFLFSDGSRVSFGGGSLQALHRVDIRPQTLPGVLNKVNSDPKYRFYTIVVGLTEQVNGTTIKGGAGIAQITRIHAQSSWLQTMTSGPMTHPGVALLYMDAPQFD